MKYCVFKFPSTLSHKFPVQSENIASSWQIGDFSKDFLTRKGFFLYLYLFKWS